MNTKKTVSILDTTSSEVRSVIQQILGVDYNLCFAESYDRAEQLSLAKAADYIWVGWPPVDAEMIASSSHLKVIHKCGVGVDDIDVATAKQKDIKVFITSGVNAVPVSELSLLLMMTLFRRLPMADSSMREGLWIKKEMRGLSHHLTGKIVGIVGMGNIGKNLAKLLRGFDCRVLYYDVMRLDPSLESSMNVQFAPMDEIIQNSDAISLHMPLTQETKGLFNYAVFKRMKKEAVFINCARGELVVELDLIRALQEECILGAGLDVFDQEPLSADNPLLKLKNVVLTPHIAGSTINNMNLRAERIKRNLNAFDGGGVIHPSDIIA